MSKEHQVHIKTKLPCQSPHSGFVGLNITVICDVLPHSLISHINMKALENEVSFVYQGDDVASRRDGC